MSAPHWSEIDRLRDSAKRLLKVVAREFGDRSAFYAQCEGAWRHAEKEAVVSLLHADFENATALLDLALQRVACGREVAQREELEPEDLAALMQAP